jgi:hypothetical protein
MAKYALTPRTNVLSAVATQVGAATAQMGMMTELIIAKTTVLVEGI